MSSNESKTNKIVILMTPTMYNSLKEMAYSNRTSIADIFRKGAERMLKDEEIRKAELEAHRAERRAQLGG